MLALSLLFRAKELSVYAALLNKRHVLVAMQQISIIFTQLKHLQCDGLLTPTKSIKKTIDIIN
jgi:4'-phosphopantetheinyl transferase EntD